MKKERKSLYIGVALFMAGIIAFGFLSDFVLQNTNEPSENVKEETVDTIVSKVYNSNETVMKVEETVPVSNEVKAEEPEEPQTEEPFSFIAPVNGPVIVPFSGNELVFSETLQEYRKHSGIDVHVPILNKVLAAESGVIKEVKKDRFLGITIVIDHKNGFETVYSNLSTENMVKEGDEVEKGAIISGVGDTAILETGEEAHLHFELYKDGKAVNPEEYISF